AVPRPIAVEVAFDAVPGPRLDRLVDGPAGPVALQPERVPAEVRDVAAVALREDELVAERAQRVARVALVCVVEARQPDHDGAITAARARWPARGRDRSSRTGGARRRRRTRRGWP